MGLLKTVKKHAFLFPLYACIGAGCVGAISYGARVALYSPDVQWIQKTNGEISNEEYRNKQYKLYSPNDGFGFGQQVLESPAPKY